MLPEFPLSARRNESPGNAGPLPLDAEIFGEPHFGFIEDVFQAGKTGEWKLTDRNRAHFADRRFIQRRTAAFFMDQDQHGHPTIVIESPAA
jgi:hypothetical protein